MKKVVKYVAFSVPPEISEDHKIRSQCYLCGSKECLDEDHVIPKVLFSPNTTTNYIKLWACSKCNKIKGKEDEYVARSLQVTSFTEDARKGFDNAVRGFKEGHGLGIRKGILDNVFQRPLMTKHGEFPEVLKLDIKRINNYLKTIAKGLYVRNTLETRDWEDYEFKCWIDQALLDTRLYSEKPFSDIWKKARLGEYWQNIFTYRGEVLGSNSMWVMCFYGSFFAAVGIQKKDKILCSHDTPSAEL